MAVTKTLRNQKEARFSIRASARQKEVIAQAARLRRTTMSDFVLEQAYQAAQQVLQEQVHFVLPKKEWRAFCSALDAPPKVIPALQQLFAEPSVFDGK
jgi:uncharacterized protein (DUF1778 family)